MSRSIRYYLRLTGAFFRRFSLLIVFGLVIGIVVSFLLRSYIPKVMNKTDVVGLQGRYNSTDLPNDILSKISMGLTVVNEKGEIEPGIAESWLSPDNGKTWTFIIKDNLFWQDGSPVTIKDINYEFSNLQIEKSEPRSITFKLDDNYALFPYIVSKPIFKKGLLGIGEWKVDKITLTGDYISEIILIHKSGDKTVYKFYPSEDRAITAFKLGKIKKLANIFNFSGLSDWQTINIDKQTSVNKVVLIFFNTKDKLLSDKNLRHALSYSIDRNVFESEYAYSPISPNSWAYNPQVKKYEYNLVRAQELYSKLPKELMEQGEITLITSPVLLSQGEKIVEQWSKLGIKTKVLVSSVRPEEFQAYLTILDIPDNPDQYSLWHSTQDQTNISNYSNPRIDKLLEDGRKELSPEESRKIYLDFQRFLLEDAPAVYLYHPLEYSIERK